MSAAGLWDVALGQFLARCVGPTHGGVAGTPRRGCELGACSYQAAGIDEGGDWSCNRLHMTMSGTLAALRSKRRESEALSHMVA